MQTPNPFYAGREFGPATAYGLPVTVRVVPQYDSDGAFSLSLSTGSPPSGTIPARRGNASPLLKEKALFDSEGERETS
jgi:hypothetical protein